MLWKRALVILKDIGTADMQAIFDAVGKMRPKQEKNGDRLSINTFRNVRRFFHNLFELAATNGYFPTDVKNPIERVKLPKGRPAKKTYKYTLAEEELMISLLPEPAATVIATASYTGARRSELRGMQWEDYRTDAYDDPQVPDKIFITQSIWNKHVKTPKTENSEAPVPIVRRLADRLRAYRIERGSPQKGPLFPNGDGNAMDLNNLANRVIIPTLRNAAVCLKCGKKQREHVAGEHEFQQLSWRGWHGFRGGLATNLHNLAVPDTTIQQILRHGDVTTSRKHYIDTDKGKGSSQGIGRPPDRFRWQPIGQ